MCASVKKIFGVESLNFMEKCFIILSIRIPRDPLFRCLFFKPMIDPVDEKDPNSGNCGIQKS